MVDRYALVNTHRSSHLQLHEDGFMVKHEDYAALEKERDELKKRNDKQSETIETDMHEIEVLKHAKAELDEFKKIAKQCGANDRLEKHNREIAARAVESCADYLEKTTPKMRTQSVIARKFATKIRNGDIEL